MKIRVCVQASDQARIPLAGPAVVVANHPDGMLDGAILTVLLTRIRPDVKVLTNFLLADIPDLSDHCIFVDPVHTDHSVETSRRGLRQALTWLHQGGMLAIFPAGEVHWHMPSPPMADRLWNETAMRLIRRSGASALPVYFCGHTNVGFQLLSMIHPRLRAAFLMQEFLQQEGKTVEVRVGTPIDHSSITGIAGDREATEYLRWRTYLLARRHPSAAKPAKRLRPKLLGRMEEPLAAALSNSSLAEELIRLTPDRCLAESGNLAVYLTSATEIPCLLREVGRLRELTFRHVGEGTGKSFDLDRFDEYYWHLLLWDRMRRELVGAYRAGSTAEILPVHGLSGLYTSTLFRYDQRLFDRLGPAWELGRSFVRLEYQRQYAPLLLLWKGIARLVARRPDIPVLFGAVSISNGYSATSREMIYRFFESRMRDDELANLIEPRRPFRPAVLQRWDYRGMYQALHDLDELSQPITDIEADGKGLPILLRQYDKIGGRMVGFNVDRKFSNVLDGLVVVDLRRTTPAVLERYMGRDAAAKFREYHALEPA